MDFELTQQTLLSTVSELTDNEVFIGFLAFSLFGALVFFFRTLVRTIKLLFVRLFLMRIELNNQDDTYFWVVSWLYKNEILKKIRSVKATTKTCSGNYAYEEGERELTVTLSPGDGGYLLWAGNTPFYLNKSTGEPKTNHIPESITITTLGRSRKTIEWILSEAKALQEKSDKVRVYSFSSYWGSAVYKSPRPLESVIIDTSTKQGVVEDLRWFLDNQEWYLERGIPYHRGYLMYGPPGTGKTSFAFALASHFEMNLCVLNPTSVSGDSGLVKAFNDAPLNSIILIEDIDTIGITHKREEIQSNAPVEVNEVHGVTLSGLLNTLDGICSPEGRVVVMTTNHKEKLDPALIRSGRVDLKVEIDLPAESEKRAMVSKFYPEADPVFVEKLADGLGEISMADTQEKLIRQSRAA